jgi:hypothetical protein
MFFAERPQGGNGNARGARKKRLRVWRVTPSSRHRSATLVLGWPIAAIANRTLATVILKDLNPTTLSPAAK